MHDEVELCRSGILGRLAGLHVSENSRENENPHKGAGDGEVKKMFSGKVSEGVMLWHQLVPCHHNGGIEKRLSQTENATSFYTSTILYFFLIFLTFQSP